MKRALVLGGGALMGAYDAGVMSVLCRVLPRGYIQTVYMSSVAVFQGLAFAGNQPEIMEDTWRNHVHGRRLIGLHKPLVRRKILDLDYLVEMFTGTLLGGTHRFDIDTAFSGELDLLCVLTDSATALPIVYRLTAQNVWEVARGTCALPYLYPPVVVGGRTVCDGGLADAFPLARALAAGHDEVIAVYNKPAGYCSGQAENFLCQLVSAALPSHLRRLVRTMEERRLVTEALFTDPRVRLIRPSTQLALNSMVDTERTRLNAALDLGIVDALTFSFSP